MVGTHGHDGVAAGWFDKVKTSLHLERLKFSTARAVEMGMYLGFGFLVGYMLKRFSAVVLITVLIIIAIVALGQFGIVDLSVNADRVKDLMGLPNVTDAGAATLVWQWIKDNVILVLSFLVGFIVGIRLA